MLEMLKSDYVRTAKAKGLLAAAVTKVSLLEPLEEREVPVTKSAVLLPSWPLIWRN